VNPSLPANDTTPFSVSSSCCAIAAKGMMAVSMAMIINFFIIALYILLLV
jgi:hypothetical protein